MLAKGHRMITTFFSRIFNRDLSKAKKSAKKGPVFITGRGRPAYVLLSIEHYRQLIGNQKSIIELLAMPSAAEINFEPTPLKGNLYRPADLS